MTDTQPDTVEQELGRLRPAAPPPVLMSRLEAARPARGRAAAPATEEPAPLWPLLLRWLAPAGAMLIAAVLIWRAAPPIYRESGGLHKSKPTPAVVADAVEIQRELVKSFDTVAVLPTGEPVRFRCREWLDEVTLRDRDKGLVIEQRTPRVEVIPVRFETY